MNCFKEFLTHIGYEYKTITDIENLEDNEKVLFDLSPYMKRNLSSVQAIEEKIQTFKSSSYIGGVFEINPFVGIYVFFKPDTEGHFLNLRGNVGAFPEMITLKEALVTDNPSCLNFIKEKTTIDFSPYIENINRKLSSKNDKSLYQLNLYIEIIQNFLMNFQEKEELVDIDKNIFNSICNKTKKTLIC